MVAKGQITGAASLGRVPMVAEEVSDSVPMGRGERGRHPKGGGDTEGRDHEIRSGSGLELVIPCGRMKLGQLATPQWEGAPSIGSVGLL
jgi:hypothetical protein